MLQPTPIRRQWITVAALVNQTFFQNLTVLDSKEDIQIDLADPGEGGESPDVESGGTRCKEGEHPEGSHPDPVQAAADLSAKRGGGATHTVFACDRQDGFRLGARVEPADAWFVAGASRLVCFSIHIHSRGR